MRKKNFKGRFEKRRLSKCEDVCRTFDVIQYAYADLLIESSDIKSFRMNALLDGLEGDYTSDFVCVKTENDLMVRECHLTKPLTVKLLQASKDFWLRHGDQTVGLWLRKRVLAIEKVLVIDCIKKTMPVWVEIGKLDDFVEEQEAQGDNHSETANFDILEDYSPDVRKIIYQRYNIIFAILPFVADEAMRSELITKMAEEHGISKQSVRKYLCEYLAAQDMGSLAPQEKNIEKVLTQHEKNMRKALNKYYYTTKKRTLKNVYTMMLRDSCCNGEGNLFRTYSSFYQFRYFFRKYNTN